MPAPAQTQVPLVELGWLAVPVYLNDGPLPLRFILDTGASTTAVTATNARRFGHAVAGDIEVEGASGATRLGLAIIPSLRLGDLRVDDPRVLVVDDAELTTDGHSFDGIIGADLLSRFDVLIDVTSGWLRLYPPGAAAAVATAELAPALPIELVAGHLVRHRAAINGVVVDALLDSGARRMLVNRAGSAAAGIDTRPDVVTQGNPGLGSQSYELRSGPLGSLHVGTTRFSGLHTLVGDLPVLSALALQAEPMLIIGAPLLHRCPVLIGYSTRTVRYCRLPLPATQ